VLAQQGVDSGMAMLLRRVQNELFDVGADLCTPVVDKPEHEPLRVTPEYITRLESECDQYNEPLSALRSFILPGGTAIAAHLHVARTVVRRAERTTWAALDMYHGGMNSLTATYLNRLSDLLFILARVANVDAGGDVLWEPGASR
jgi:cob(I)alamin adenosyltransferase